MLAVIRYSCVAIHVLYGLNMSSAVLVTNAVSEPVNAL